MPVSVGSLMSEDRVIKDLVDVAWQVWGGNVDDIVPGKDVEVVESDNISYIGYLWKSV